MQIIKPGNLEKIKQLQKATKRFKCSYCDCVFEADKGEYTPGSGLQWDWEASAECPCCGRTAIEVRMREVKDE